MIGWRGWFSNGEGHRVEKRLGRWIDLANHGRIMLDIVMCAIYSVYIVLL